MPRIVMFFTDSRGNTGGSSKFPTLVDNARSDFTVALNYQNGRTTAQGIVAFEAAYATIAATGDVTDVVFLLGVADFLGGVTPAQSATNLRTLQGMAEAHGARAWIMTQCPAPILWGGVIPANEKVWATRTELFDNGPRTHLIDSMYEFTMTNWYAASSDELHPTGLAAREALAKQPIAVLP
jgi:hypothetical protein